MCCALRFLGGFVTENSGDDITYFYPECQRFVLCGFWSRSTSLSLVGLWPTSAGLWPASHEAGRKKKPLAPRVYLLLLWRRKIKWNKNYISLFLWKVFFFLCEKCTSPHVKSAWSHRLCKQYFANWVLEVTGLVLIIINSITNKTMATINNNNIYWFVPLVNHKRNHFLADMLSMGKSMMKELLGAFPGIDEAMSFAEVMRYCIFSLLL